MTYHPRPERWPQVSLKGLFVLVTIFGVWLAVQAKWIRDRHAVLELIDARKGVGDFPWYATWGDPPRFAPLSIRVLGECGIYTLTLDADSVDLDYARQAQALFPKADVNYVRRTK